MSGGIFFECLFRERSCTTRIAEPARLTGQLSNYGGHMTWERASDPLKATTAMNFTFSVQTKEGKPAQDLEPYMGMATARGICALRHERVCARAPGRVGGDGSAGAGAGRSLGGSAGDAGRNGDGRAAARGQLSVMVFHGQGIIGSSCRSSAPDRWRRGCSTRVWNEAFSEDRDTKRAFATSLVIMLAISILRKFQLSLRFSPLRVTKPRAWA